MYPNRILKGAGKLSIIQNNKKTPPDIGTNPWSEKALPQMSPASAIVFSIAAVFLSVLTALNMYNIFVFIYAIGACALAASVFTLTRSPLLLAIPAASYGITLILTRSAVDSAASLICFGAAAAIAFCIFRFKPRVTAVCAASFALGLTVALFGVAVIIKTYGSINIDVLKNLLQVLKDDFREALSSVQAADENGNLVKVYSDELINSLIRQVAIMSPAIIISTFNIIAFAAVKLVHLIFGAFKLTHMLPGANWKFSISAVGAITYIIAYIVTLFMNSEFITAAWAVTANVIYILQPGLLLIGATEIIRLIRQKKMYFSSVVFIFITIMLFLLQTAVFIVGASFLGAFRCIKESGIIRLPKRNI